MKTTSKEMTADSVACWLHNNGSTVTANTQKQDVEWFARELFRVVSGFGMGWVRTVDWTLANEDFKKLQLTPDRKWTGKNWETLKTKEREAWMRLSFACLYSLPAICERVGHRGMEQAKAIHLMVEQEIKARLEKGKED